MSRDSQVALALGAPLVAALVFSWVRLAAEPFDVPADADYAAARAALDAAGYDATRDGLALLPPWTLRPLQVLGDLEPIGSDELSRQPLHRHARLFVLVEPDGEADERALVDVLGAPQSEQPIGRTRLLRFDRQGPGVGYDFRSNLAAAQVVVVDDSGETPCTQKTRGGVRCPGDGSARVAREWMLVSENADLALWAHPPAPGKRLELRYPAVPLGRSLVVRAGFTRDGADRATAPVQVDVVIAGQTVATLARAPRFAFDSDVVDTAAWSGQSADVTLVVRSADNTSAHFGIDAYAVAP